MDRTMNKVMAAHVEDLGVYGAEYPLPRTLTKIERRLKETMVPVAPRAAFVRSLGRELMESSRRRRQASRQLRRGLIIGAAALGSAASVAGVVALVIRRKRLQAHPRPVHG